MTSSGRLWGRHANVDSPSSSNGPLITAGWHTLIRVWDGQQVRQYLDGRRTNTVAVTATGGWSIYKWGWQFFGSQALDEAYVPLFGAFGAAWDDALVARWSADPLGLLWPEQDAALVSAGGDGSGDPPVTARRPVPTDQHAYTAERLRWTYWSPTCSGGAEQRLIHLPRREGAPASRGSLIGR